MKIIYYPSFFFTDMCYSTAHNSSVYHEKSKKNTIKMKDGVSKSTACVCIVNKSQFSDLVLTMLYVNEFNLHG
jgi:hypothetical protein